MEALMLLSAEHLSLNFGSRQLLDDVNFYLNEGDKTGVIGINGTGKSTFLRCLAGQETPDSGVVTRFPNVQVVFLEQKCHLRYRLVSIFITVIALLGIITALFVLTLPPALRQIGYLSDDLLQYATTYLAGTEIPEQIAILVKDFDSNSIIRLLQNEEVMDAVQVTLHQSWNLVSGTFSVVWGIVGLMMMFLYLIFILLDYENVNQNWVQIIPKKHRKSAICLATDIKREMNAYFRGQATVAFLVGVLFSIGFVIIDRDNGRVDGIFDEIGIFVDDLADLREGVYAFCVISRHLLLLPLLLQLLL